MTRAIRKPAFTSAMARPAMPVTGPLSAVPRATSTTTLASPIPTSTARQASGVDATSGSWSWALSILQLVCASPEGARPREQDDSQVQFRMQQQQPPGDGQTLSSTIALPAEGADCLAPQVPAHRGRLASNHCGCVLYQNQHPDAAILDGRAPPCSFRKPSGLEFLLDPRQRPSMTHQDDSVPRLQPGVVRRIELDRASALGDGQQDHVRHFPQSGACNRLAG